MKKLAIFLLIGILLSVPVDAQWGRKKVWVYQINNTSTSAYSNNLVASTLITAGSRILGWSITPYRDNTVPTSLTAETSSVLMVGLWDTVTDRDSVMELVAEIETENDKGDIRFFDRPLVVETALWVNQGPYTTVLLYYEK